jgi:X-X-X-Leu-X-X-Gly heptad repeat protein
MRLRHPDGQLVHLGYCTNVHPAEDLAGILAQLDTYAATVRGRLDAEVLGLGLWLAAPVAAALADAPAARRRLRRELDAHGFEVVTLNGVPYRTPQEPRGVYQPDWTSRQRLEYTLNLARVLADLLPEDAMCGSVSTIPLAWREPWDAAAAAACARLLDELAEGLTEVAWRTGRLIQVGFAPEPGCVVETTEQAVAMLRGVDTDRIGVCLDLAHLACAWEDPVQALTRLEDEGLPVVKVQVSAALEVADPAAAGEALRSYAVSRWLRQTRSASGAGADDLDEALAEQLPGPWRVRYHVPVHAEPDPPLATTRPVLRDALDALLGGPTAVCDHLEVATYTWQAPPDQLAAGADRLPAGVDRLAAGVDRLAAGVDQVAAGVAGELAFTRDELQALGLTPVARAGRP